MNFELFLSALQSRYLADLRFSEVTRALVALSSRYVENRHRLTQRGAFDSAGKRAAYALYYSPLHFMTVSLIVEALDAARRPIDTIVDLGCGAGAAGAAWGLSLRARTAIGIDTHPRALEEAQWTYRFFGLEPQMRRRHAARMSLPQGAGAIVAGWMINELDETSRSSVLPKLLDRARGGAAVLIVEPIATRISPWWSEWAAPFSSIGGRSDEWRFAVKLPDLLMRLDRAAGLRHGELTAKSLYVPARL